MNSQFTAALDVLVDCTYGEMVHMGRGSAGFVRSALEAAQQEAQAWEAIVDWLATLSGNAVELVAFPSRAFGMTFKIPEVLEFVVTGDTRLEALAKAAAWCRAEMSK